MVTPYITFAGDCRAALEFYGAAFHAVPSAVFPYGEYVPQGVTNPPEGLPGWVLHAELNICGTDFWFADEVLEPVSTGTKVKLTAKIPTGRAAREIFELLSDGGRVTLPPTDTFYSTFHAGRGGPVWRAVEYRRGGSARPGVSGGLLWEAWRVGGEPFE